MLSRDTEAESKLLEVLRDNFARNERTGVHLTSLLEPRMSYWKATIPMPPTDAEVGFFSAGRGHEDAVQKLLGTDFKETEESEVFGIHLRPDFEAISDRVIPSGEYAEFKTRRSNLPKTDVEANAVMMTYRDQLRGYMALKGRNRMWLIVLSLVEGKDRKDPLSQSRPVFAVYREEMTEDERIEMLVLLMQMNDKLKAAFVNGDPFHLPLCTKWKCVRSVKVGSTWVKVPVCKWYNNCKPGDIEEDRRC